MSVSEASPLSRALKRDEVPLTNPSPSPLKERGTEGVR